MGLVPQISQLLLVGAFEKVQALQDQRKEGEGETEERQIWQVDFWEGGLRKVHLEHSHEDEEEDDDSAAMALRLLTQVSGRQALFLLLMPALGFLHFKENAMGAKEENSRDFKTKNVI